MARPCSSRRAGRREAPAAVLLCLAAACASEGFPPGGPEDLAPPALVETSPADREINAVAEQVITLRFDDVIDDRQLRELPRLIRVNPDVPDFDITLDEDTVTLAPQSPLAAGLTYNVTVLPGLKDRAGNATVEPRGLYFSVGGEEQITVSVVRATILRDSVPAAGALYRIENTETELGYNAVADSQGGVEMEAVEYGRYTATAWLESEGPEGWQMTEEPGARDTFDLSLENRLHEATYRIAVVDTTAPVVVRVETPSARLAVITIDDRLGSGELAPGQVALYEGVAGLDADIVPDSLPLDAVRARQLTVESVSRAGASELRVVPAAPLDRGGVYRLEIPGVVNESGRAALPETGRTFRAEYEGPVELPAEAIPWTGP